jgi:class 3 adenylate cyclase
LWEVPLLVVVGGLPVPRPDHAEAIAEAALDMLTTLAKLNSRQNPILELRIGIHTGPVVAGVIGERKFSYDLWGDTVNTASRMESHGVPGRVQVSRATYVRLCDKYVMEKRGVLEVKGKGGMDTFLLTGRRLDVDAIKGLPEIPG